MMERRISKRKVVDVNVYVAMPGQPALRCAASDISDTGVFLKTNPLFFPRRKQLNLVFALHIKSSNVVRMRQVPAVVARSESDGIGMVFCKNQ
jgi:hypothetical protein